MARLPAVLVERCLVAVAQALHQHDSVDEVSAAHILSFVEGIEDHLSKRLCYLINILQQMLVYSSLV